VSSDKSVPSFVNGLIAGAGAALALMSVAFLKMTAPLEGLPGFETTEIRVAILMGGIVAAVAAAYEFYGKKDDKKERGLKEKPKLSFVRPDKDPSHYIRRYLNEPEYKKWFDRNHPSYTIYEAAGISEVEYLESR